VFWADDDTVYRVTTYVPWSIADGTGLQEPEVPHPNRIHGVVAAQEQGSPPVTGDNMIDRSRALPAPPSRAELAWESEGGTLGASGNRLGGG
jgi:hypothetical protein